MSQSTERQTMGTLAGYFRTEAWSCMGDHLPYKKIQLQTPSGLVNVWIDRALRLPPVDPEFPVTIEARPETTRDIYGKVGHEYLGEQTILRDVAYKLG